MRWLWVTFLTIMAALMQVSLMGALRIGGVVPNLVLILVVCLVAWGTASEALLVAVLGGLLLDIAGTGTFGLATSSLVFICLCLVALRQFGVDGQAWPLRLLMVALASLIWAVIHIVSIGVGSFASLTVWRIVVTEVAVNCVLALVFVKEIIGVARTV